MIHDPIARFGAWLEAAKAEKSIIEPTAFSLATATAEAVPSVRIVLLKAHDARGFVFYTNYESRKAQELMQNPHAAIGFHWEKLERQVRVRGGVEKVSAEESDAYFASRARGSQLGAWASAQSRPLASRAHFLKELEQMEKRFAGGPIPRPPYWGGFRIVPHSIEFWSQVEYRLHEREVYTRVGEGWEVELLYP